MSGTPFTPEDVVKRYRELGIKPSRVFHNLFYGETYTNRGGTACAAGVMLIGHPASLVHSSIHELFGLDYDAFWRGFDGVSTEVVEPELFNRGESFRLGQACAEAIEEAIKSGDLDGSSWKEIF